MHRVLFVVLLAAFGGACATGQARSGATLPPLTIPEPPPRALIDPAKIAEPEPPERVARPAPSPPETSGGRQGRPVPTPAPAPPAAAAAPAAPPVPELRPGSAPVSARAVAEMMERTARKLAALDRRRLSAGQRADYDAAQRFLSQAREAAKANNPMLAQYSAEKAETLADGLR